MFTGIVEERGEVADQRPAATGSCLTIRGPLVSADARPGDSIAVNGCCLTVTEIDPASGTFTVDVIVETLRRTSLGRLVPGTPVNLERSVRAAGRLSGHLVQGHVDGTGTVLQHGPTSGGFEMSSGGGPAPTADETILRIAVPTELARYIAPKGSIAVEGVSLTVVDVRDDPGPSFSVALIPTTLRLTTLGALRPNDPVNLEVDVLAKYVERLISAHAVPSGVAQPQPSGDIQTQGSRA